MNKKKLASKDLPKEFLSALKESLAQPILTDPADCWPYGYDNSRRHCLPQAVVFPSSHSEIQAVVGLCNQHLIPVTARGRGTGTTGASVPIHQGIILSLEKMDRILEIDPKNRLARVQPGVTNQQLQDALAGHGFFWPPDPTSAAVCTIGGNLAYNSAGPRAVKYGTPRENTLGLMAVTGSGQTLKTGVSTTKGVVGYDLTRLLIGSEGSLAITTEAILKLTPLPEAKRTIQALFSDIQDAARAISDIMSQSVTPCALELMDHACLRVIRQYQDLGLPDSAQALLMIEVDGTDKNIQDSAATIQRRVEIAGAIQTEIASSSEQIKALWRARKALSPSLRNIAPKKINEDVVVPVSRIPELINGLDRLSEQTGIQIVNFGHAGNGNIHVNLLLDPDDPGQAEASQSCLDQVFDLVLSLDGTLSGEHGVGLEKQDYVARELDSTSIQLMHKIKHAFDPNNILNPGKEISPS